MADTIPPNTPAVTADMAAAQEALTGQGEVIGGIQSALAGAVDAQLAANQQAIAAARARLTKTSNKASKGQAGMVNGLAGMLGETIATSIAPGEQAQQQIGTFTATRAVPPVLPRRVTTGTATAPASGGAVPPSGTSGLAFAAYPPVGSLTPGSAPTAGQGSPWGIGACVPQELWFRCQAGASGRIIVWWPYGYRPASNTVDSEPGWVFAGTWVPDCSQGLIDLTRQANDLYVTWFGANCANPALPPVPPALPPIPPPALPPVPPSIDVPVLTPAQHVTTEPISGAFCVCPLNVPPIVPPPDTQTITKGFEDMANWLAALGDSILRASTVGADVQEGGREWIDACVWDPLARLVVRHFDQDDGPTADVVKLMANSQSCLLSNVFTRAVKNYMPGLYPDKARAVMAVKNVLESLLDASVAWGSSGDTMYHAGVGLDAAGSVPPPPKPPKERVNNKWSRRSK